MSGWAVTYDDGQLVTVEINGGDFRVFPTGDRGTLDEAIDFVIGIRRDEAATLFELVSRSNITLRSGVQGIRLEYRFQNDSRYCVQRRVEIRAVTASGFYGMLGSACEFSFDRYEPAFSTMISSFRLLPSPINPTPTANPTPPSPATAPRRAPLLDVMDGIATLVADDGTFLGKVSSSRFDSDSICNRFGNFGSEFSVTSVRNALSQYGSRFSSQSAYNQFTSSPPAIMYLGAEIGFLTKNEFLTGAVDPEVLFAGYDCEY